MLAFALTSTGRVEIIAIGGAVIWLVLATTVAMHGRDRGYPFWPLFFSAVFLGFPLVLLAVTIGAGPGSHDRIRIVHREWPGQQPPS